MAAQIANVARVVATAKRVDIGAPQQVAHDLVTSKAAPFERLGRRQQERTTTNGRVAYPRSGRPGPRIGGAIDDDRCAGVRCEERAPATPFLAAADDVENVAQQFRSELVVGDRERVGRGGLDRAVEK